MYFSPAYLSSLIVEPLRYYFGGYATPDLVWTSDAKTSTIEIDTINNFNKIAIQAKPRVLISRGAYSFTPTGLSDNLAEGKNSRASGGVRDVKFLLIQGQAQILIEASNEGTCEKVTDLVKNFLTQASTIICNEQGFKQFGLPLSVSPCTPSRDDVEIFSCSLGVPWTKEVQYKVEEYGLELKGFLLSLVPETVVNTYYTSGVRAAHQVTSQATGFSSGASVGHQVTSQATGFSSGVSGTHEITTNSTTFGNGSLSHVIRESTTTFSSSAGTKTNLSIVSTFITASGSSATQIVTTPTTKYVAPSVLVGVDITAALTPYVPNFTLGNIKQYTPSAYLIDTPDNSLWTISDNFLLSGTGGLYGSWLLDYQGTVPGLPISSSDMAQAKIDALLSDLLTQYPTGSVEDGNTFTYPDGSKMVYSIRNSV